MVQNAKAIAPEIVAFFTSVGFAATTVVAVLSIEHQIVKKLCACTTLGPPG